MKKSLLLITLFFPICFATAQWESQYPLPTENALEDVCFINDMDGWAVGELGTILYTTNGGLSWDFQNSGTELRLRSVVFTEPLKGWIVGGIPNWGDGHYIILHTTDGGINWIEQGSDSTSCLRSVFFLDSENGWAVGDNDILHTDDAGDNWTIQQSGTGGYEVFFTDLMNGWVASSAGLLKTTDGGLNWNVHIPAEPGAGDYFESVFFIDQNEGWASNAGGMYGQGAILHTTDAFDTWDTIALCSGGEEGHCGYYSLYFKDPANGWMFSYSGSSGGWWPTYSVALMKTTDGGISWVYIDLPTQEGLNSLYFIQQGKGFIVGEHGVIFNTDGWSDQWGQISEGNLGVFFSIAFPDNTNGWAVGGEVYNSFTERGSGSAILNTSDGGLTWKAQNSNISGTLNSVNFIDEYKGWAVGNNTDYSDDTTFIIHTTNGGEDWITQKSDTSYRLYSICFTDDFNGWAVGSGGRILNTGDGGNNWKQQDCDSCKTLRAVHFVDSVNGWATGDNAIYNTTDGGQSWTQQFYDTTGYYFKSVYFTDSQNGWVVGNKWSKGSILLHTMDGGNTWLSDMSISNVDLYSVHFTDEDNGLISGSKGSILLTRDGGVTWEMQNSGTDDNLFSVIYTNDGHGYAAGAWGTIVHWDTLHLAVNEFSDQISDMNLINFPNPFSTITTIEYEIKIPGSVLLSVYNCFGEQIELIAKSHRSVGKHKVVWNTEGLPAGLYFCVLRTDIGTHTTKMIKMK